MPEMILRRHLRRITDLFHRAHLETEFAAELQSHIDMRMEQNIAEGMSPEEARRDALRRFGNTTNIQERVVETRMSLIMESVWRDVRCGFRQVLLRPGFAAVVVITLGLGIGAASSIFTLLDQVLLRMLPVDQPHELVRLVWTGSFSGSSNGFGGGRENYFSYPMYKDLRDKNQVFRDVLATMPAGMGISWKNEAQNRDGEVVSGNYFELLGLKPAAGRLFTSADESGKGANAVVVLAYDYWKIRFAGARDVIGQTVLIDGHPFTIVGVAPAGFSTILGGYHPALFVPITMVDTAVPWMAPLNNLENHQSIWLTLVGRRKPGVTSAQAEAGLAPLWHALRAQELLLYKTVSPHFRESFWNQSRLRVEDGAMGFSPSRLKLRSPLMVLLCMAGLLMTMCTLNIAILLLLRASARSREMAMRYALGAHFSRIASQLLMEGAWLGCAGAVAGVAVAPFLSRLLVGLLTHADPGTEPYSTAIDLRVIGFAMVLSVAAAVAFSLAPVFHFLRPDTAENLRTSSGSASHRSQRMRKVAVGFQVVLSMMLFTGAFLLVRTISHLRALNLGYETDHLVTFSLDPAESGYHEADLLSVINGVLEVVKRSPDVTVAAANTDPELAGNHDASSFSVQGYQVHEDENLHFETPFVTPGYFSALHQPLLAGRDFTVGDAGSAGKVAVISLTLAKRFFGSPQKALGHLLGPNGPDPKFDTTIVGVVGNIRHESLHAEPADTVYRPYLQMDHPTGVTVYARTRQNPEAAEASIRRVVHDYDGKLIVDDLHTMDTQVNNSAATEHALAVLAMTFASFALLLAGVGLYGVLAYATLGRTREFGVRLALGSQRSRVLLLVAREIGEIGVVAFLLSAPLAYVAVRLLRSQLYGITSTDPLLVVGATMGMVVGMLVVAAAVPARRAVSMDLSEALRTQ